MQYFCEISGLSTFIPEWTVQRQLSERYFFNVQLAGIRKAFYSRHLEQLYDCPCIPMPPELSQVLSTGGHFRIMSLSRHFHVKSVLASLSIMQTISTTFLSHVTPFTNYFRFSFFSSVIYLGCIIDGKRKGLYLHNRAPSPSNSSGLRMAPLPRADWQLQTLPYCRAYARGWCATMVTSRQGKSISKEAGSRSLCRCLDLVGGRDQLHLVDSWAVEVTQSTLQRRLWPVR